MKHLAAFDALIFDLFGVMLAFDNDRVYARLARHCADPAAALPRLNGVMARRDVITGRTTLRALHAELAATHGLALDYAGFVAAWKEPYSWPMPGMAKLVRSLAGKVRLLLLSNVDGVYWPVVRAARPELACFDATLLSCDLGMAKPDAKIFLHASACAEAPPSRCLFIDDTLAHVEAARALDFQVHHFTGTQRLIEELRCSPASLRRSRQWL